MGRPRPDIINRCQPPTDLVANPQFGLTSWTVCTRTDLLKDGFRSFPSGHASFAWAGLWYMTLFVAGKMCIWDRKGYTLKSWLLLIPVVAASLVAISRTMDYRHHATDIIAGSILGILVAWYAYRQYYPVSFFLLLFSRRLHARTEMCHCYSRRSITLFHSDHTHLESLANPSHKNLRFQMSKSATSPTRDLP